MAKRRVTAAELMSQLNRDPAFVQAEADRDARLRDLERSLIAEEAPLLADLAAVGVRVNSVWDLVNTATDYARALPILLQHLRESYHPRNREGMARALAVRSARGLLGEIVDLYQTEGNAEVKTALACAIAAAADDTFRSELMRLAADRRHGGSRAILLHALAKKPTAETRQLLESLQQDESVAAEAKFHLRGMRRRRVQRG